MHTIVTVTVPIEAIRHAICRMMGLPPILAVMVEASPGGESTKRTFVARNSAEVAQLRCYFPNAPFTFPLIAQE